MERSLHEKKDYIDMDIITSLINTIPSPPHSKDFEFQICSKQLDLIDDVPSPADELFYKGKLLPLHLPRDKPYFSNTIASTAVTPYESCNVSPAASCCVSGELNADDYFDIQPLRTKRSWTNKVKQYLKSLFAKSARSGEPRSVPEAKKAKHRRSFSGAIKRRQSSKSSSSASTSCSSSLSSMKSSEAYGPQGVDSEAECSIQGAIAYCKKSQKRSVCNVEIDEECEKKENPELCRG